MGPAEERSGSTIVTTETREQILALAGKLLDGHAARVWVHRPDGTVEQELAYPQDKVGDPA